ncbi:MAG: NtrC family response regulator [Bacteroidetes bacterium]|nr:NtrC family response regulator [Bacteroidota bacterium]
MAHRILVVDDEKIIRDSISFILKKEGYSIEEAANGKEALAKINDESFDVVITDIEMPVMKGIELLDKVMQVSPQTLVIIITAYGSLETAIAALRAGASDYILKPLEFDELLIKMKRLLEARALMVENQLLRREIQKEFDASPIVGKSPVMKRVFDTIFTVAGTDSTVLITGKSGTGKELVARAIHYNSRRRERPFVAINCGAIPETLIESELFGHKRGSFTGAVADKIGYFKAAEGGTLFLDEVSEMPVNLQVKLLRAIEQREITPVGMSSPLGIDTRFLASTNRELLKEVEAGRFREDLYYRLNVVEIHLPPLGERKEDIPLLVEHFISKYRTEMRKNVQGIDAEVMRALMSHAWKGEVRELSNIIERAVIFCKGEFVAMSDLPEFFRGSSRVDFPDDNKSLQQAMNELEKTYIERVLRKHNFDKEQTAAILGISLPTLYRRIKELGIPQE